MNLHLTSGLLLLAMAFYGAEALAFEPPVFPLSEAQLKGMEEYQTAKGIKAFAAGPGGQFSVQAGFASATIAAVEALKACDTGISEKAKRCILIDLDGEPVPLALQYAQMVRVDEALAAKPIPLRDLTFDVDTWRAYQGLAEKGDHKAFAMSLKGPWGRSWDGASIEEAEKEALQACNRNAPAAKAPCFIVARDRLRVSGDQLQANPDLSVDGSKLQ